MAKTVQPRFRLYKMGKEVQWSPDEEEDVNMPTKHPKSPNQEAHPSTLYATERHPAEADYAPLQQERR